jgi:hypothetical protein
MKEHDYVMKIMATGGVLEEDDTCREIVHVLVMQELASSTRSHLIGVFAISMQLTTTKIYVMLCLL